MLDDAALRAARRAQDEMGQVIKKGRPKKRGTRIPVLDSDPSFDSGINLWMDPNGNLRSYAPDGTKYQYAKTAVTSNSGSFPFDFQPETLRGVWSPSGAQSYCDDHGIETGSPGLWYGDSADGLHHNRRIMIEFAMSTVRTAIANSTIEKVEIFANNLTAFMPNVSLHWGLHNSATLPAAYAVTRKDYHVEFWPAVGNNGWQEIHPAVGEYIRDSSASGSEGFTIEQPLDSGPGNSGLIDWTSFLLRITYTKTS